MPNWTVKEAVDSVMNAINAGAPGIDLSTAAYARLRKYYETTFTVMHENEADWDRDQLVVLPLAHLVGLIAAVDETSKSLPRLPSEVSEESAVMAAGLVSLAQWCEQEAGEIEIFGGYCKPPIVYFTPARALAAAAAPFRRIRGLSSTGAGKTAKKRGPGSRPAKKRPGKKPASRTTKNGTAKKPVPKKKAGKKAAPSSAPRSSAAAGTRKAASPRKPPARKAATRNGRSGMSTATRPSRRRS